MEHRPTGGWVAWITGVARAALLNQQVVLEALVAKRLSIRINHDNGPGDEALAHEVQTILRGKGHITRGRGHQGLGKDSPPCIFYYGADVEVTALALFSRIVSGLIVGQVRERTTWGIHRCHPSNAGSASGEDIVIHVSARFV